MREIILSFFKATLSLIAAICVGGFAVSMCVLAISYPSSFGLVFFLAISAGLLAGLWAILHEALFDGD